MTGRAADVLAAAHTAAEVALRLIRPGKKVRTIRTPLSSVCQVFICLISPLIPLWVAQNGAHYLLFTDVAFFVQNKDVTEAIQKVAAAYDCKIAEGVLSHQMKQFVIDANKVILSVSNPETRVDDAEFEENEVYAVDIVTSTGDGKVYSLYSLMR